ARSAAAVGARRGVQRAQSPELPEPDGEGSPWRPELRACHADAQPRLRGHPGAGAAAVLRIGRPALDADVGAPRILSAVPRARSEILRRLPTLIAECRNNERWFVTASAGGCISRRPSRRRLS